MQKWWNERFGVAFHRLTAPHCTDQWDFITAPHEIAPGRYAWWTLPSGVRSFDATDYIGIDDSFEVSSQSLSIPAPEADVASQTIRRTWEEKGPYDAILGHSQGAIILSVIIAKALVEAYPVKVVPPQNTSERRD